jgi:hypothetical protein
VGGRRTEIAAAQRARTDTLDEADDPLVIRDGREREGWGEFLALAPYRAVVLFFGMLFLCLPPVLVFNHLRGVSPKEAFGKIVDWLVEGKRMPWEKPRDIVLTDE